MDFVARFQMFSLCAYTYTFWKGIQFSCVGPYIQTMHFRKRQAVLCVCVWTEGDCIGNPWMALEMRSTRKGKSSFTNVTVSVNIYIIVIFSASLLSCPCFHPELSEKNLSLCFHAWLFFIVLCGRLAIALLYVQPDTEHLSLNLICPHFCADSDWLMQ